MESILSRYRNLSILAAVLFAQVLTLAYQIKKSEPGEHDKVRLLRVWAVAAITPLEKVVVNTNRFVGDGWHNYFWLRGVRKENAELRAENERLRLEQVRLVQDAAQARRLQALVAFKEQFISQTVAAQVIGSGGSELSRTLYLDKGTGDGIKPDMAVVAPEGIVGKVIRAFHGSSQVLLITDQSSGVGAILTKSRLQGILKGTPSGEIALQYIMTDEKVEPGEPVVTSGGDRVFPKGLPIGTITSAQPGPDMFLNIRVKPAAPLARVEEVLVITKIEDRPVDGTTVASGPVRAADILAQRLPTVTPSLVSNSNGEPLSTAQLAARERAAKKAAEAGLAPGVVTPAAPKRTGEPPSTAEFLRQQRAAQTAAGATAQPTAPAKKAAPTKSSVETGHAPSPPAPAKPSTETPAKTTQPPSAPPLTYVIPSGGRDPRLACAEVQA
jgi:rod shape-determining protein MreC